MDLKTTVLTSLGWLALGRAIAQLTRWGITLVVIRILTPDDYGLMALAEILLSFLALFSSAGLASALIQAKNYTTEQLRSLLGALIAVNAFLLAIAWLAAPYVADFFQEDRLVTVVRWLMVGFVFGALEALPMAILSRKMRYKAISMAELAAGIGAGVVTLFLALGGFGYKALMAGFLVELALRAVLKQLLEPTVLLPSFKFQRIRRMLVFGGTVTLSGIVWFAYMRYDVFIAGRMWDTAMLGVYVVAMQVAMIPMDKVMSLVKQVAFAAFSSTQDNVDEVRRFVLKGNRLGMLLAFPVFFGISVTAPVFLPLLLGDKWVGAVVPLQLLSCVLPLRVSQQMISPALQAIGRPGVVLRTMAISLVVMVPILTVGASRGVNELALSWALGLPLVYMVNVSYWLSVLKISRSDFAASIAPSFVSAIAMYATGAGIQFAVGERLPPLALLGSIILPCAAVYVLSVLLCARSHLTELIQLFALRKEPAAAQS